MYGNIVKTIEYENLQIPVYIDNDSQFFFIKLDDEEICLGKYNVDFETDVKFIIAERLNHIYTFPEPYCGASIKWFDNGGIRDIELLYRNRILKIFLTPRDYILTDTEKNKIIETSLNVLQRMIKL